MVLARAIDWDAIERKLRSYYKEGGRRAYLIRLMVGLHLLKHLYNCGDERAVQQLKENLYWMAFCGIEGALGCTNWIKAPHPTTLVKFRQRIGVRGTDLIEAILVQQQLQTKAIDPKAQFVDTTVQPKNIRYPRDTHLLDHGRRLVVGLVRQLNRLGVISTVRSFARRGRAAILRVAKAGKDKKETVAAATRDLITYAQEVIAGVPAVVESAEKLVASKARVWIRKLATALKEKTSWLVRVIHQAEEYLHERQIPDKVLSLHEPQVVALPKRKRGLNFEFGSKVSLSMDRHGFVVSHEVYHDARHDLETLDAALTHWEETTGKPPAALATDRGYHTARPSAKVLAIPRVAIHTTGKRPHPDRHMAWFTRLQGRRSAMEPVIGHLKSDHRMDRCYYKGKDGDRINVAWAVMAWNARKWARHLHAKQANTR
jgi:IS5 family transposase